MDPLQRVPGPVRVATTERAFDPAILPQLDQQFAEPIPWVRHDESFYRCFIAEVDEALPGAVRQALREHVATALQLDLAGPVRITAQRMAVGDGAARHTDRPLAGYEVARLIVQLDSPAGGCFRMLEPAETGGGWRVWLRRPAVRNQAVALELSARAHHEVTPCASPRRTVVMHFWHRANPPHARQLVDRWLGPMTFAALPSVLDPLIARADATFDDRATGFAGRVAWLLDQWGCPTADLPGAFERALRGDPAGSELQARARFVVGLALDAFERSAFEALPSRSQAWWLEALTSP